jgi:putative tryptophan/tyrosine transport system substrate-binding protein
MASRRAFLAGTITVLAAARPGETQPSRPIPRVGFLSTASQSLPPMTVRLDALRQAMRELGYIEGQNIAFEFRSAEGNPDQLPARAAELVSLNVDCIVTAGDTPTRAAKQATQTIPIVMTNPSNPVEAGLVASLARPGGNVTGLTAISTDLARKRLGLLKEMIPKLSRVTLLYDPRSPDGSVKESEEAARMLRVRFEVLEVRTRQELEQAFGSMARSGTQAVIQGSGGFFVTLLTVIVDQAARYRLPMMYIEQDFVRAGGLIAYATNVSELYRRAAGYVDRILKGAKPADLPIEQPTKFELVINLKTAKTLSLTIPPTLLSRADEVIQ